MKIHHRPFDSISLSKTITRSQIPFFIDIQTRTILLTIANQILNMFALKIIIKTC